MLKNSTSKSVYEGNISNRSIHKERLQQDLDAGVVFRDFTFVK